MISSSRIHGGSHRVLTGGGVVCATSKDEESAGMDGGTPLTRDRSTNHYSKLFRQSY